MVTSLTLSILATRGGKRDAGSAQEGDPGHRAKGSGAGAAPAAGSTVPITVQAGSVGGKQGAPQTIPVPVTQRQRAAAAEVAESQ